METPYTVELEEPLGDRVLVDANAPTDTVTETGGSDSGTQAFCSEAVDALGNGSFPVDGGDVVGVLRKIDLRALAPNEQQEFTSLVDALEQALEAFKIGNGPDGWSTSGSKGERDVSCVGVWCECAWSSSDSEVGGVAGVGGVGSWGDVG